MKAEQFKEYGTMLMRAKSDSEFRRFIETLLDHVHSEQSVPYQMRYKKLQKAEDQFSNRKIV